MSINPVSDTGVAGQTSRVAIDVRPSSVAVPQTRKVPPQPDSELVPTQDNRQRTEPSASAQIPQDEVQVQRDTQSNGQIVIKYLDHSGQVILQIPSSQVLGLARAIERTFEEQASREASSNSKAGLAERKNVDGR